MLVAEAIHKKYKQPVLNGVSLSVNGGEIVGIAGENGSGKSTLLSVLTSVVRPDTGRVMVEGEDIFKNPRALKRWVGYVPQENSLFDNLTARDNLKLWASAYDTDWKNALPFLFPESEAKTEAAQRAFLKKKAGQLSGGMKKRLSIALSIMHGPRYLIMDEPSAGLDIGFKWALSETMRTLKTRGCCVLFTSHQPDELLLCDRIYVLRGGLFVYSGDPNDLNEEDDFTGALHHLIAGQRPKPVRVAAHA